MASLKAREHVRQLQSLPEKDPEFYQFLKDNDNELLEFNDEDIDENQTNMEFDRKPLTSTLYNEEKLQKNIVTTEMVDSWIKAFHEKRTLKSVNSLLRAFRTACHCGDDVGDESFTRFSIISSSVFNKIMMFVLNEMDGILRELLGLPASGGKKETMTDLMTTKKWAKFSHYVKSYIGNALHVLNQMTDTDMIAYTLRRLRYSSIFFAAFPSFLRKYIKAILHFWGTGSGALPVASFLFLRDLCIRLGSNCTDVCFKGTYKAYMLNCHFVNAVKLQHIQFLGNCFIELLGVDLSAAYQHAFAFIRQLAMILRQALSLKTKDSFRKVFEWRFMNSLELWTGFICAYSSDSDIKLLCYPLTQIITGVASSSLKAQYFPLRLRCARMLNRIATSTVTFIPISKILLDMLGMKELNKPPSGGIGKTVDLYSTLKVSKPILKTRSFQEACVFSVIEELAKHLAQWSYSIAFTELSFLIAVRARSFRKSTKVERFRREMGEFIRQIEANSKFVNAKRLSTKFLPNDPALASFLEDEKGLGRSPMSQYAATIDQKARQKSNSISESSVVVGAQSSVFGHKISESKETGNPEEAAAVFSSSWLPKAKKPEEKSVSRERGDDEDVVEELVLSSDEDDELVENGKNAVVSEQEIKKIDYLTSSGKKRKAEDFGKKRKKAKRNRGLLLKYPGQTAENGVNNGPLMCY